MKIELCTVARFLPVMNLSSRVFKNFKITQIFTEIEIILRASV